MVVSTITSYKDILDCSCAPFFVPLIFNFHFHIITALSSIILITGIIIKVMQIRRICIQKLLMIKRMRTRISGV